VPSFLKTTLDDGSSGRAKIGAFYVALFTAKALVFAFAAIALSGRPTLLGSALLDFGHLVVGIFVACWVTSYLLFRWQRLDQPMAERVGPR
jgi:hypothetical protein